MHVTQIHAYYFCNFPQIEITHMYDRLSTTSDAPSFVVPTPITGILYQQPAHVVLVVHRISTIQILKKISKNLEINAPE